MKKAFMGLRLKRLREEQRLTQAAGIPMPEVGVYQSDDINAFATGPSKSRSLVAVSSGLLSKLDRPEVEGVLGHEITHIANGDMVTMTLLQGVVNAFVMFLARVLAFVVAQAFRSRIILRCAQSDRPTNGQVACEFECNPDTVGKWRTRFAAQRLEGLADLPRSGAPRTFSPGRPA